MSERRVQLARFREVALEVGRVDLHFLQVAGCTSE